MVQLLGEVKIKQFLEHIVAQFHIGEFEKDGFLYKFRKNAALCEIGYERQHQLFARNYNFTIRIEKPIQATNTQSQQVSYSFQKKCWVGKTESSLLAIANKQFSFNWHAIDFLSLTMAEEAAKRVFTMTILPGSYTTLIFPPMKQGIAMHQEEITVLQSIINIVSSKLDCSI